MRIRSLRPERMTLDRGDEHWRGARLMSTAGATSTIKVWRIGAQLVGTAVIQTSLLPADGRSIGQPLCVRLAADLITVVEIIGSTWASGDAPKNEGTAAAGNGTHVGIVPRSLTQEPVTFWEEGEL